MQNNDNDFKSCHCSDVTWVSWRLKPPTNPLFVPQFIVANNKESINDLDSGCFAMGIRLWSLDYSCKWYVVRLSMLCLRIGTLVETGYTSTRYGGILIARGCTQLPTDSINRFITYMNLYHIRWLCETSLDSKHKIVYNAIWYMDENI